MNLRHLVPKKLRPSVYKMLEGVLPLREWRSRQYSAPSPWSVKIEVLRRYGSSSETWIETGTYLGDTTNELARWGGVVHTIEPSPELAQAARLRFRSESKVTVHEGVSEDLLPGILASTSGSIALWLDGHWSDGLTFRGPLDTPIVQELESLSRKVRGDDPLVVLVDDVRCFDPTVPGCESYPTRSYLVEWADRAGLSWTIEQDIFVAWNRQAGSVRDGVS